MSESETTKEGDVILVPSGMPYIARKRPSPQKGARKLAKKKKMITTLELEEHHGEEVFTAPGEEAEIESWEREMREAEEAKKYKKSKKRIAVVEEEPTFGGDEEGEEEEGEEEEGGGEEEPEEISGEEEFEEEEEPEEVAGARYQEEEEYVYKKVPVAPGQKEQAALLGITIPEYEIKLLPQKVRRRIYETEIRYPGYQRMRVGADGELIPIVENESRPIKIYGEDLPLKRSKVEYSPPGKTPPKINPYNSQYPFGTYVSFSDIPAGTVKGIVMGYTKEGVEVSVGGKIHFVEYTNPSLKIIPKPKTKKTPKKRNPTVDDFLTFTEIPDLFREMIIDSYVKILKTIKEPFKPSKKVSIVDWELLQHPPLSWDEYYSREYQSWVYAKYYQTFLRELDSNEIEQNAKKLVELESSVDGLLEQITELLPDGLWYTTTIDDVLKALKAQINLTVFQAHLTRTLEQEITAGRVDEYVAKYIPAVPLKGEPEKYYRRSGKSPILRTSPAQVAVPEAVPKREVTGKNLANILRGAIESYQKIYQPDLVSARKIVTTVAVRDRFNRYEPTDEDRMNFEIENLVRLTDLHISAEKEYEAAKKKADAAYLEDERIKELIQRTDQELEASVKRFEQLVYAAYGDTVHSYLSNALIPYIFLDGPLSTHAKFFREKLANGSFEFSALISANIAHYLPEFAMNQKLTDAEWEQAYDILGRILNRNVIGLIELYIAVHDPLSRIEHKSSMTLFGLADKLIAMLISPGDVCFKETGTGVRPVIKSGRYVYKSGTEELLMEHIPPGEMTICYANGKFTCHEIRSILRAISTEEQPINPYTGQQYPPEFIAKMKVRYADRLNDPDLWQEPEDPISSPKKPTRLSPEKPKKKTPSKPVKKEKARHKPPKKAKGKIGKIAVIGEYFDVLTSFASDFKVFVKDQQGRPMEEPLTFEFTDNIEDPEVNVVVLSFDASNPESISDILVDIPEGFLVYAIGVDSAGVKPLDRAKLTRRIQKAFSVEHTFYIDTQDEEELVDALINVVIDVEAIKVF